MKNREIPRGLKTVLHVWYTEEFPRENWIMFGNKKGIASKIHIKNRNKRGKKADTKELFFFHSATKQQGLQINYPIRPIHQPQVLTDLIIESINRNSRSSHFKSNRDEKRERLLHDSGIVDDLHLQTIR